MKKLTFIICFVLASLLSQAQLKAFGLKTGLNYSSMVIDETFSRQGVDWTYAREEAEVAPIFGAFARFKIMPVFIQPELMVSDHKTTMRIRSINLDSLQTLRQNRIDIPFLIGYSRRDRLRGYIGPVYTKVLEHNVTSDEFLHEEVRDLFEGGSWALQLGMGFDMGPLVVDIRYETNLGQISNSVEIRGHTFDFDHRNNVLQVSLGWDFIR